MPRLRVPPGRSTPSRPCRPAPSGIAPPSGPLLHQSSQRPPQTRTPPLPLLLRLRHSLRPRRPTRRTRTSTRRPACAQSRHKTHASSTRRPLRVRARLPCINARRRAARSAKSTRSSPRLARTRHLHPPARKIRSCPPSQIRPRAPPQSACPSTSMLRLRTQ
ncbi:hypothetical protein OBBRIDRAFT_663304 [Obba rivulosa]|uniref:Uncharacterized protein n=1 Tax=Obba rivulosa TaxID=1052685 RepID=A0A8E2AUH8_9APHY|nr:hypothetical protein OBBRIDRAFT_663304 [Obba rivulosa]